MHLPLSIYCGQIFKLHDNFTFQLPSQTGSTKSYQVMETLICLQIDE